MHPELAAASITNFIEIHRFWGYVLLFFGIMIEGDMVLLLFSFLASQDYFRIDAVCLITFVSMTIGNNIWYEIGKKYGHTIFDVYGKMLISPKRLEKVKNILGKSNFQYIFLTKFIYGLNHIVIMMAGHQRKDVKKLMKVDMIGTVPWLLIVSTIGYVFGYAFKTSRRLVREIGIAALVLLVVFILFEKTVNKVFNFFSEANDDK
jgi:membrane protein DedA with SNARE-associated domain